MSSYRDDELMNEELSGVNVTPLADVSLTLLIILMIISPMVMHSMIKIVNTKVVAGSVQEAKSEEKPLFIVITKEEILLNTQRMDSEEALAKNLVGELIQKKDRTVLITADPDVRHGQVVHILDLAKQAGATQLSLVKRKGAGI